MYSEVCGYRVNLAYLAIVVALNDIVHILIEFRERFERFQDFEDTDAGCVNDLYQDHCLAIYSEIGIYVIDFVFTVFLIYGVSSVIKTIQTCAIKYRWNFQLKTIPVLVWIVLSSYHLVDFLLFFTPIYGAPLQFSHVPLLMWADIGKLNM